MPVPRVGVRPEDYTPIRTSGPPPPPLPMTYPGTGSGTPGSNVGSSTGSGQPISNTGGGKSSGSSGGVTSPQQPGPPEPPGYSNQQESISDDITTTREDRLISAVEGGMPSDEYFTTNAQMFAQQQGITEQGAFIDNTLYNYGQFNIVNQSGRTVVPKNYNEVIDVIKEREVFNYRQSASYYSLQGYDIEKTEEGGAQFVLHPLINPDYTPSRGDVQQYPGGPIVNVPEPKGGLLTSPEQHEWLMGVGRSVLGVFDFMGVGKQLTPDESGISPLDRAFMPNLVILKRDDPEFQEKYIQAIGMGGVPYSEYTGVKLSDIVGGMLSTLQAPFFFTGVGALTKSVESFPIVSKIVSGGSVLAGGLFGVGAVKQIVEEPSMERKIFDVGILLASLGMGSKASGMKLSSLSWSNIKEMGSSLKDKLPGYKEVRLYTETGELRLYRHYKILGDDIRSPFYLKGERAVDFDNLIRGYHPKSTQMTLENFMGRRNIKIGEPSVIDVSSKELASLTGRNILIGGKQEGYLLPRKYNAWGYTRIGGEDIIIDPNVPITKIGAAIKAQMIGFEVPIREDTLRHELAHSVLRIASEEAVENLVTRSKNIKKPFDYYLRDNEVVISERLPGKETKTFTINDIIKRTIEQETIKPLSKDTTKQLKLFPEEKATAPISITDILQRKEPVIIPKTKTTALTLDDILKGRGERLWVDAEGNVQTLELEKLSTKETTKRQYTLSDITKKPLYDLTKTETVEMSTVLISKTETPSRTLRQDITTESVDVSYVGGSPRLLNLLLSMESGMMNTSEHWTSVKPELKQTGGISIGDRVVIQSDGTISLQAKMIHQGELNINDVLSAEISISDVINKQLIRQDEKQELGRRNIVTPLSINLLSYESLQSQSMKMEQELQLKSIVEQELLLEETPFGEKIKIPKLGLPGDEEELEKMSGPSSYILKLRNRQYRNGKRIDDRTYHPRSGPLSFDDAMSLGVNIVSSTEKASFELEESNEKPRRLGRHVEHWTSKIAEYNQTKENRWVEDSRHRIDSPGELREITMNGIQARMR